ncbi:MAG: GspH/FimT family pseudopilin [Dokdonella sp.]
MVSTIRNSARRLHGFTLVELVVAVSIVAILAALALPSFREMSVRMTITSNANDLVGALNLARTEAVKRGYPVNVVATSSNWKNGWSVTPPSVIPALTLQSHPAVATNYKVLGAQGATASTAISFNATGNVANSSNASYYFSVCRPTFANDQTQGRVIEVKPNGSITSYRRGSTSLAPGC